VVSKTVEGLSQHVGKAANGAKILILGIAYKKNVNDLRESPAFAIIKRLTALGAEIAYYDPYAPIVTKQREHPELVDMTSITWDGHDFSKYDAAIIVTDHDGVDYAALAESIPLIVDTRNAMSKAPAGKAIVVKA
jgi:UDP-N-acetyl-D-glucosamine dehydrogenase